MNCDHFSVLGKSTPPDVFVCKQQQQMPENTGDFKAMNSTLRL